MNWFLGGLAFELVKILAEATVEAIVSAPTSAPVYAPGGSDLTAY